MKSPQTEGLGGSLALYFALMAGALALFVAPFYYFNAAEVHENPGLAVYEPPVATRVIPPPLSEGPFVRLRSTSLDPAAQAIAEQNIRKLAGGRGTVTASRRAPAETTGAGGGDRDFERPARSRSAYDLLGSRMSTAF
ncbi:MAG: hypothetical protein JOZ70_06940 [Pseudolabrys sp.]|nr:hypothetical protein [Pseudolabrys sp.]MBV9954970.1 hypothetical protein [Pseudolabrys sp.]